MERFCIQALSERRRLKLKQISYPIPTPGGLRMDDYYESFSRDEAQQLGGTLDDIRIWQPPEKKKSARNKKAKKSK
ncbi:MAG: hypothetical protein AAFV85_11980 [Cyanobacteria bacterium J06634_6]